MANLHETPRWSAFVSKCIMADLSASPNGWTDCGSMADVFSKAKRSAVMSRIRSRENRDTELRMIALFRQYHLTGWRRRAPLPGKPDFIFRVEKVAIFVDGCFWHGCPRHGHVPTSRIEYWAPKLARNAQRDRAVTRTLRASGWRVLRIWECALARSCAGRTAARIARVLHHSKAVTKHTE